MEPRSGTYVVVNADEGAAELRDVASGQVFALADNPGVEAGEVVEATVEPVQPVGAAWEVAELDERRAIEVTHSEEPPTRQAERAALDQPVGELTRIERAGTGEVHVITVEDGGADDAAGDVLADETDLRARAGRLGVGRVEVRTAEAVEGEGDAGGGEGDAGEGEGDAGEGEGDAGEAVVGLVSVRYLP